MFTRLAEGMIGELVKKIAAPNSIAAPCPVSAAILGSASDIANGRACHVRQPDAAHRAARAGAREDHFDLGANPAPRRWLRRGTGAGRGTAVVGGRRLSLVQRHP